MSKLIKSDEIQNKIYIIRGAKVMLDRDLADLYGVETKVLKQAVRRKIQRFPVDFMYELTKDEFDSLRSQIVTSKRGGERYMPMVFTEQGVAMLSSVLNSDRAIAVNIQIMRAFTQLRKMISTTEELKKINDKINRMEKKYDDRFKVVFDAIKKMIAYDKKDKKNIGFK